MINYFFQFSVYVNMNILLTVLIVRHLKLYNVLFIDVFFVILPDQTCVAKFRIPLQYTTHRRRRYSLSFFFLTLMSLNLFVVIDAPAPHLWPFERTVDHVTQLFNFFFCNYSTISIQALGIHAEQNRITSTHSGIKV